MGWYGMGWRGVVSGEMGWDGIERNGIEKNRIKQKRCNFVFKDQVIFIKYRDEEERDGRNIKVVK